MSKRPKQHQTEDQSKAKYNLAIPRAWVFREKDKDYGIDAEVEIFDENGNATGLLYFVQLKATESIKDPVMRKIDLSIEALKYYKSLDIPVLIVRYAESQDRFYSTWASEIDQFYSKKNAKTIKVSFNKENIWNEKSPDNVKEYLEKIRFIKNGGIKFPIPIGFLIKDDIVNGIPKGVLVSSLRKVLHEYPKYLVFQSDLKDILIQASLSGDELKISLSSFKECTFHNITKREHDGFAEGIVADTLIGCAIDLVQIGQCEMAAQIVMDNKLKSRFVHKREVLISLIPYLLNTSYFGEIMDVISDLIPTEKDNSIEMVTLVSAIHGSNLCDVGKIEDFLKKCLNKYLALGLNPLIGTSYYNLGNHYRGRGLYQKAIRNYLKARRYDNTYLNRAYYYKELGGALFEYEKYHFSSMLYKMALDKSADDNIKPLYADALMHSGKYQQSLDAFSEFLKSNKGDYDEWRLKMFCLRNSIEITGIKEQSRRIKEAITVLDFNEVDKPDVIKLIESSLAMDMLCGLAWFNLGVECNKSGNTKNATISFAMCGLLQRWDIEAWVNATILSLNRGNPEISILYLILRTAYFINGDKFLSKLYDKLNTSIGANNMVKFTTLIEEILPKTSSVKEKPIIRIMGKDGTFKNIFEEGKA